MWQYSAGPESRAGFLYVGDVLSSLPRFLLLPILFHRACYPITTGHWGMSKLNGFMELTAFAFPGSSGALGGGGLRC